MTKKLEKKEHLLTGAPGSPGIVIGSASLYKRERPSVSDNRIADDEKPNHVKCFHSARDKAKQELCKMLEAQHDESASELIRAQIEMLKDPELGKRIEHEITVNNQPADSAIKDVFESYLRIIRKTHDKALERTIDIADVRDRLIQILHDHDDQIIENTILVARELSPREVIEFSSRNVKGIVMDSGGATSHAAIIARSMNIPTVVGLEEATNVIDAEQKVVLDGSNGEVIVNPSDETLKKYHKLIDQEVAAQADFENICKQPNETADGHPFSLKANIEFVEELSTIKKYQADGIGLLRTESIYLSRENFSDQKRQQTFYETILELSKPAPVTIRLFDAGGDTFFEEGVSEQNPFLGWRGIRMLLDEQELLYNQLTAILKTAAKFKDRVRLLVPMISTIDELSKVKKLIQEVQHELLEEGITIDRDIPLGIMVEVPSVALQAGLFAKHADFLSIGTNDLTQYVLAVDRGNERISNLYDQRHPAIWRIIKSVVDASSKEQSRLSVCGELAANPIAACCLMGLGIKDLSMNPVVLPTVKQMLRTHSLSDMRKLSQKVLQSETLEDIDKIFSNWKNKTKH